MLRMYIWIENYTPLIREFGSSFMREMERRLAARAVEIGGMTAIATPRGGGCVKIICQEKVFGGGGGLQDPQFIVEHLLVGLSSVFACKDGRQVFPVLSVSWDGNIVSNGSGGGTDVNDIDSQSALFADMQIATMVHQAIATHRLMLVSQSVCNVFDQKDVLYLECLSRIALDDCGDVIFPSIFMPSLERLGLMRFFDRHILRRAVRELFAHSDWVLGVNISAQSAVDDAWWALTVSELAEAPDVARRLVIEITETAHMHSQAGRRFCRRFRDLGCRIAIDDFGAGFSMQTSVEVGEFDLVKIDGSVLRRPDANLALVGLLDMVRDKAPNIVVECVETEQDLRMVREAGVEWVQGNYFGSPAGFELRASSFA